MNLLHYAAENKLEKSGVTKQISIPNQISNLWIVYKIPLEFLYYNDKNGRINTVYKQYLAENKQLEPEPGNTEYNNIFEKFIYDSNSAALDETLRSIKEKGQQEPGVILADGRVIDGNRRFTALRMLQNKDNISKTFDAVILPLDVHSVNYEKTIKELELDLQLGREERINYDPIDRIFDVYNTIEIEKLMTAEEYKKASGAKSTVGIQRDIRLAKLILKFINIVSPGEPEKAIDKFYLARELKLDGPIEDIERFLTKTKDQNKEAITDAVLTYLAVIKSGNDNSDATRLMRDVNNNILKNEKIREYFLNAVDEKVDYIIDAFHENPIKSGNDLKLLVASSEDFENQVNAFTKSVTGLVYKGGKDSERKASLFELEDIRERLLEFKADDFRELTSDEFLDAKNVLKDISDILFKLKKDFHK